MATAHTLTDTPVFAWRDENSNQVGIIPSGVEVKVIANRAGYVRVSYDDLMGWVQEDQLKLQEVNERPESSQASVQPSITSSSTQKMIQSHASNKVSKTKIDYLCVPFSGATRASDVSPGRTLAEQLQRTLKDYNSRGWEFMRIDTVRVDVEPGCIPSLLGAKNYQMAYDIIVFRKKS